jgi:hypothetical protein
VISNHIGTNENTYQAKIKVLGMGSIFNNHLHLVSNAL